MSEFTVSDPRAEAPYDPEFTLPALDDPPSTEAGVILLGLDTDRLLAGLGLASVADDPAQVTLLVDQARHGTLGEIPLDALIDAGRATWASVREILVGLLGDRPVSPSVRRAWVAAYDVIGHGDLPAGPATRAYLTACWLRRAEFGSGAH